MTPKLPMIEELSVSLVAEVCGTCANWTRQARVSYGTCEAMTQEDGRMAYIDTDTPGMPELLTKATFGCVLWASKNAVERVSEVRVAKG